MDSNHAAHPGDHTPNVKLYLGVFAALMALTVVTVMISRFHLPRPQAIALGLLVASIKAGLVGAIFMHLWGEKRLIHKFLYVTAFFGVVLILVGLDQVIVRKNLLHRMPVAEQRPAEK